MRKDVRRPGVWERAALLLFPARCLWCGRVIGPGDFCCGGCGPVPAAPKPRLFQLERGGRPLEVRAPALYQGGYRRTLHRYKFMGEKGLSGQLGRFTAGAAGPWADLDGVAYVPLSKRGRRARGYDQGRLLAKSVAKALGLPLLGVLEKSRENQCQHGLGRAARIENVKGAYRAGPGAEGKALLLVDDIVTTGATLCQCAKALYDAGARQVYGLCAASAEKKEGQHASF